MIAKCVEAFEYLTKEEIACNLGCDKMGVFYFVVYGAEYTKFDRHKKAMVKEHFNNVILTASEFNKFALIYVHTGVKMFDKGALSTFRKLWKELPHEKWD